MARVSKSLLIPVLRTVVELAVTALEDVEAEIEAFEKDAPWYTPSPKMMDRIERAQRALEEALR